MTIRQPYICISELQNQLNQTLDTTRVALVDYNTGYAIGEDHITLESIRYNIHTDQIQVKVTDRSESNRLDSLQSEFEKINSEFEQVVESKDNEIYELVQLLRAYQRKEKGTADRASTLLSTKYRNIG